MILSRSYRTRIRRSPLIQLIVRSTTQRTFPSTTALACVATGEAAELYAGLMEAFDPRSGVAFPSQCVTTLVVVDVLGDALPEPFSHDQSEPAASDDRIGRSSHLADGPLWIFPPATCCRLESETSS